MKKFQNITGKLAPVITIIVVLTAWFFLSDSEALPSFMLPGPGSVVKAFVKDFPALMQHSAVTLQEAGWGLLIGFIIAVVTAVLMDRFSFLNKALYPVLIVTQTIPSIALAPLLVLWFGFEMTPKIVLVVITTFFPITVGLLGGLQSADKDAIDLFRAMGASRWQIYRHIKFPSALGSLFSGLKIAASYSVVGAVISEWLGGFEGLGVYMTRVRKAYAFDKMFAVIVLISLISLLLMWGISLLEKVSQPWLRKGKTK